MKTIEEGLNLAKKVIDPNKEIMYRNYYRCPRCDERWDDDWTSTSNTRCPNCNIEVEPYDSEQLNEGLNLVKKPHGKTKIWGDYPNGSWVKRVFDDQGNMIYREESTGAWIKIQYDNDDRETYKEWSDGKWAKWEYDKDGTLIYFETEAGIQRIEEHISDYKKPLTEYIFARKPQLRTYLTENIKLNPDVIKKNLKSKPREIADWLLTILESSDIKQILSEGSFKCTIEDVEKKAKKIIFVKYNWDPKNVVFTQENDSVQITAMMDLKPDLQNTTHDDVMIKFLTSLSKNYTKDLNSEFSNFCGRLKFLSHLSSDVTSSVYCYSVIQQGDAVILYNSNGEKKRLKHGNHPQYQINKLYFKIGLFANNINLSEGLNLPKKDISTPAKWFQTEILNKLTIATTRDRPNSIFYKLNNEIVMEYYNEAGRQELNNGSIYVKYFGIWSIFESRFGLNYGRIQGLIKGMVEEHYKFRYLTPFWWHGSARIRWKNITNLGI